MKVYLIVIAILFSTGCSIPYWIEYSYKYNSKQDRLCILNVIRSFNYENTYEKYDRLSVYLNTLVNGSENKNMFFSLEIYSDSDNVFYKMKWTSVNKATTEYMKKRSNIVKFHKTHLENFKYIINQCVKNYTVTCRTNIEHKNIDSSCIDE